MKEINDYTKRLLDKKQLNMRTLALVCGLSYETVYALFTKHRPIEKCTIGTAIKICDKLDITLDELYQSLKEEHLPPVNNLTNNKAK